MNSQPPIYVINMAKDVERMASMAHQLGAQGLYFERVEAVAGRDLTPEKRRELYSGLWFWLLHGRAATANELGCTLSHRKAWQTMVDRGQDWAIFFEDDAEVSPQFATKLAEFEQATLDFDMVQFHSFRLPDIEVSKISDSQFQVMKFNGTNASAVAYALRGSGAQKLLKHKRVHMNADKWVWARALLGLKLCAIFPFPAWPHKEHSAVSTIGSAHWGNRRNYTLWRVTVLPVLRVVRWILLTSRRV